MLQINPRAATVALAPRFYLLEFPEIFEVRRPFLDLKTELHSSVAGFPVEGWTVRVTCHHHSVLGCDQGRRHQVIHFALRSPLGFHGQTLY